jgi:integrase
MTLPIDVRVRGIGRVQVRSGTKDKKLRVKLADMVRDLPELGYLDVVRDIASGRRTLLEVYGHYKAHTMARLVGPSLDERLQESVTTWLDGFDKDPDHVEKYRELLAKMSVPARATLRDLPSLLAAYRVKCEDKPRMFNLARSMCQAFVRDTMGKHRPLYLDVANVLKMPEAKQGRRGVSVPEAIEVRELLSPKAARIWWSMCLTGMGPKELWGAWDVLSDRVFIRGTKRVGRERYVPLIDYPVRPELTRWGFTTALRRRGFSPYQARKTYGAWLDAAGIPKGRHDMYMGHGPVTMRDLYSMPEIDGFIKQDRAAMRAMLPQQGLALVKS